MRFPVLFSSFVFVCVQLRICITANSSVYLCVSVRARMFDCVSVCLLVCARLSALKFDVKVNAYKWTYELTRSDIGAYLDESMHLLLAKQSTYLLFFSLSLSLLQTLNITNE